VKTASPVARAFFDPFVGANPVAPHILGVCPALAVTKSVATALVMTAAVIAVLPLSNAAISLIRNHKPRQVRLIIQITIIAALVITTDQVLKAYAYGLGKGLSVFVGLIVTSCIIIGRAEAFAMKNPVGPSILDGIGNGIGYGLVLLLVGGVRELLGAGALLGFTIPPVAADGGWFEPMTLMLMAPSAFFIIGFLIWGLRAWRPAQVEAADFRIRQAARTEAAP
jgi:Na+-transporting NADH:ubiquinone oxidoreductase subunit D